MLQNSTELFIQMLSSSAAVPGGGGASALVGALGVALGSMVGNLTLGKKKYAHVEEDVKRMLVSLEEATGNMMALVQKDADLFEPLSKAYGLPKNTPEEIKHKEEVLEKALADACSVPIQIMEESVKALTLLGEMGEKGTRIAISDIGVGVVFLKAAAEGAAMNVYTNTGLMKNKEKAKVFDDTADALRKNVVAEAEKIYQKIEEGLRWS